jgi:hypothetical protein
MALEFEKLEETCSNVYLIDERLCLKNSYEILNYNFEKIENLLINLNIQSQDFNLLFLNFSQNSAKWIRAINNWETLSAKWLDAETVVSKLSSNWFVPVNVIYNKILNLETYLNNPSFYIENIRQWTQTNFLTVLQENQIISVDVYTSHEFDFNWRFFVEYYEDCIPTKQNLPSGGCSCPKPRHMCNHVVVGGTAFKGWPAVCQDAAAYCSASGGAIVLSTTEIVCPNRGEKVNKLEHIEYSSDKTICRVINIKYKKENNNIVLAL